MIILWCSKCQNSIPHHIVIFKKIDRGLSIPALLKYFCSIECKEGDAE